MKTLFIVLDTVRRDYLTIYGNTWVKTPNITRLAERGVVFDNHWAGSLPCMPARREFMTGRHNFIYRGWGPLEPFDDILTLELRKNKVFTHLLTDHFHYFELGGENYHAFFDTWEFFRGQEHDPWVSLVDAVAMPEHMGNLSRNNWHNRQAMQKEEDFPGPRTVQSAMAWLDANRVADDWFLQVELFDPHEPFHATEEYRKIYGDDWDGPLFDWPTYRAANESPEAVEHIRKCYAALLTMTDVWVGKLLDKLDELALWDDLMVIFTTDHGTLLGEHDFWMKNFMPVYHEIARIPLVVRLPGDAHAGRRLSTLTQTIDVMPTILDYHQSGIPPHVQGKSLLKAIDGGKLREDAILGYFGMATNITDGRYLYYRNPVNEDCGPLHAYTAMPNMGLNARLPRELFGDVEMGRYFGHMYNLPVYKIPAERHVSPQSAGGKPFMIRHDLFDLQTDPGQLAPIDDPEREAHFVRRIVAHLGACEAPVEQYERIGLSKTSP